MFKKISGLLFLWTIRKNIRFLWMVLIKKETPLLPRTMVILLVWYVLYPIDILPDFLAIFGIADDVWVAVIIINIIKKILPEKLKNTYMWIKKETKYRE